MEKKNESRGHLAWLDALRFIIAFFSDILSLTQYLLKKQ